MKAVGGVTAEQLVRALRRRHAALPSEIGTFVVFEVCETMLGQSPQHATLASVTVSEEGMVSLSTAAAADQEGAARSLHKLLTGLLVAAGPAPSPALLRLAEEGPRDGRWTVDQLRDDLEAALVPLNRTASRRVLARLVREVGRGDSPSARPPPGPSFRELDRELSSLLGVKHDPRPDSPHEVIEADRRHDSGRRHRPRDDETARDAVEDVDVGSEDVQLFELPAPRDVEGTAAKTIVDFHPPMESHPPAPALRGLESLSERSVADSLAPRRGSGGLIGVVLVVLGLALVAAVVVLRPDVVARLRGELSDIAGDTTRVQAPPAPQEGADLVVRVTNERAQILRFVGVGPVTVEHLPLGVAHEFVAMVEGARSTRVLVAADTDWQRTPEGPRSEVAMQAGATLKPGDAVDLGDSLLPADVGTVRAELGSVRIVTTPRGARVFQLIGFAPEARIENLSPGATEELLIWKRGYEPVQRVVAPGDFVQAGGRRKAQLDVTLSPLPTSRQ